MQVLPPPGCFHGPFVSVDMLMDIFLRLILPDKGKSLNIFILDSARSDGCIYFIMMSVFYFSSLFGSVITFDFLFEHHFWKNNLRE